MGDKEYEFENYHNFDVTIINNNYPNGKANRREARRRELRKRKGRL